MYPTAPRAQAGDKKRAAPVCLPARGAGLPGICSTLELPEAALSRGVESLPFAFPAKTSVKRLTNLGSLRAVHSLAQGKTRGLRKVERGQAFVDYFPGPSRADKSEKVAEDQDIPFLQQPEAATATKMSVQPPLARGQEAPASAHEQSAT